MERHAPTWDGADVTKAITDYKKLLTYTNTDRDTFDWTDAEKLIMDGKAGYQLMGDWEAADLDAKGFTDYGYSVFPGNGEHLPVAGRLVRAAEGRTEPRGHEVLAEDRRQRRRPEGLQHQEGLNPGPHRRELASAFPAYQQAAIADWKSADPGSVLRPRSGLLAGLHGRAQLGHGQVLDRRRRGCAADRARRRGGPVRQVSSHPGWGRGDGSLPDPRRRRPPA